MLGLTGCLHLPPYRMARKKLCIPAQLKPKCTNLKTAQPTITVWVHGTRLTTHPTKSYIYSKPGLHPVTILESHYHLRQLADAVCQADPIDYPLTNFYIFGWSGRLDETIRRQAAKKLYADLQQLVAAYTKNLGMMPRVRLITHSHGGNVALHIPECKDDFEGAITIDELILLACPVQEKTMHAIHDPMFKKIYALYSSMDMLQILAPQFFYREKSTNKTTPRVPFFSSRRFPADPKLAQIKVKVNGHSVFHTYFTTTLFTGIIPTILAELDTWQLEKQQYPYEKEDTRRLLSISTR